MSLVRSFYIRRLVPSNLEEFQQNPEAYQGEWQTDPEGELGEVISEKFLTVMNPQTQQVETRVLWTVLWEETKTPAADYVDSTNPFIERVDLEYEDDEEEGEEEGA